MVTARSMSILRTLAGAYALCAACSSHAVVVDTHGMGQVLLYPYYTVNGGQNTLLSLVNTTNIAKAVKLRFRESYNGRAVASYNLYLSPYDVWTGVMFATSDGSGANLLTDDKSCTLPALRDNAALPMLGDGRRYDPFANLAYTGAFADTGPTEVARTREGSIEVIEMGELIGRSAAYATHIAGRPKDCASLREAWNSGGYWTTNPGVDMIAPRGGLYGTLAVVNPTQGTIFEVAATALDGFSAYVQHTGPDSIHPNLGDARSSTASVDPPYADAEVTLDNGVVRARYVGADRTIDAVSAVLMVGALHNEYVVEAAASANTDWVVTFPTKHHYVDRALVSAALPPFSQYFGESAGASCSEFGFKISDRDGGLPAFTTHLDPLPPPLPPLTLCHETSVISMLPSSAGYGSSPLSSVLSSALTFNIPPFADNGAMQLDADPDAQPHALRPAADGTVFRGLPAIGFGVVKYVNGNITPGVLANYSAATPHRSTVKCRRGDAPCQ